MRTLGIIICIILSAFFAGAETAYNFVNENHIEKKENKNVFYKCTSFILRHYDFALSSGLVGVNIAHFILSVLITLAFYDMLKGNDALAATLSTIVGTVFVLVFCEILPKTIAKIKNEKMALVCSIPSFVFMIIFAPIVFIINIIVYPIKKLIGTDGEEVTEEELTKAIEKSEEEGGMEEEKSDLLISAIEFHNIDIREVIVPRVDVVAFDLNDGIDELIDLVKETYHSRIPVYEESIDKIIGILYVNSFLIELANHGKSEVDLEKCILEPLYIYPSTSLPDALEELREQQKHIAIVPDEYGGTLGIVTMEDILEEIVGDIDDETDEVQEEIQSIENNTYEVVGDASAYDTLEEMGVDVDDFDSDFTTLGGWAQEMLEGFPDEGKSFVYKNVKVTIKEIEERRITKLVIEVLQDQDEEQEDD